MFIVWLVGDGEMEVVEEKVLDYGVSLLTSTSLFVQVYLETSSVQQTWWNFGFLHGTVVKSWSVSLPNE